MDFAKNILSKYGWTEGKFTQFACNHCIDTNTIVRWCFGANTLLLARRRTIWL